MNKCNWGERDTNALKNKLDDFLLYRSCFAAGPTEKLSREKETRTSATPTAWGKSDKHQRTAAG